MNNRILSYIVDTTTKLILRIRHETKSYILTCWLYDRNYEYFKVASEGGQFVASVCENRLWNRLSILQCHGDRSSTLILNKAYRNESINLFNGGCSIFFGGILLHELGPFRLEELNLRSVFLSRPKLLPRTYISDIKFLSSRAILVHFCHR